MNKKVLIIGGVVLFTIIIIILVIVVAISGKERNNNSKTSYPSEDLTLTYWRLNDDESSLDPIIQEYKKQHKNVTIKYVKKDPAEYETELINAIASGNGPDLFQIHNDWLPKHQDKLSSMPTDYMSVDEYKKAYAVVAAQDLISEDKIFGIPFSIDSLALFYNKKLVEQYNSSLNQRSDLSNEQLNSLIISEVPQNWTDLIDQAKKLTNKNGTYINQAGIALGTSNNVESSQDILSLLMLQNNTKMVSDDKQTPTFNLSTKDSAGNIIYPGTNALDFSTSFASPNKETYSWNSGLPSSTTAFIQGKTAMMINYSHVIATIKNQAPDLNFEISKMPQIKGAAKRIDYANYWAEVVNKNSKYPQVAWDFLKFASNKDELPLYLERANKPSSRPDIIERQLNTSYNIFNEQLQTATDWYKNKTPAKVDQIFQEMITAVIDKKQLSQQAIDSASQQILSLWKASQ